MGLSLLCGTLIVTFVYLNYLGETIKIENTIFILNFVIERDFENTDFYWVYV